jgi:hypothetical protein
MLLCSRRPVRNATTPTAEAVTQAGLRKLFPRERKIKSEMSFKNHVFELCKQSNEVHLAS